MLLENSTFVKWWRDLPLECKSESDCIENLIRGKADRPMTFIAKEWVTLKANSLFLFIKEETCILCKCVLFSVCEVCVEVLPSIL